jgi:catechol 2,3-dioxygenase-like lactoylglutathione lyase family enzyme
MANLTAVELKPFVPARDFELSKAFYQDMGFTLASDVTDLAYFHRENVAFLLQDFYVQALAENYMLHLLVENVDDWWATINESGLGKKYGVHVGQPEDQPWGMRDFVVIDPTGVLWRIAQNL